MCFWVRHFFFYQNWSLSLSQQQWYWSSYFFYFFLYLVNSVPQLSILIPKFHNEGWISPIIKSVSTKIIIFIVVGLSKTNFDRQLRNLKYVFPKNMISWMIFGPRASRNCFNISTFCVDYEAQNCRWYWLHRDILRLNPSISLFYHLAKFYQLALLVKI